MAGKQQQKAGDQSVNVQAGSIIVHGVSLEEARQIALDVFRANFVELAGRAEEVARQRAEAITDRFLKDLQERNPSGMDSAHDPDMQYALLSAQRSYARTGDAEMADILVDLLVERTKENDRNVLQIVLSEAIEAAPRLTQDQLAALSVVFVLKYTRSMRMTGLHALRSYVEEVLAPFVPQLTTSATCYQHIEYAGCGSVGIGAPDIAAIFRKNYPGLFSRGFTPTDISVSRQGWLPDGNNLPPFDLSTIAPMLVPNLHDPQRLQVAAIDDESLDRRATELGLDETAQRALHYLHETYQMDDATVRRVLIDQAPVMERLTDVWNGSLLGQMTLTSVGIAIAHANLCRFTSEQFDLRIWIN